MCRPCHLRFLLVFEINLVKAIYNFLTDCVKLIKINSEILFTKKFIHLHHIFKMKYYIQAAAEDIYKNEILRYNLKSGHENTNSVSIQIISLFRNVKRMFSCSGNISK